MLKFSILKGQIPEEDLQQFQVSVLRDVDTSVRNVRNVSTKSHESTNEQPKEEPTPPPITQYMIRSVDYTKQIPELLKLLNKYRSVIALQDEPLGRTNISSHHINLKPDTTPIYVPAYKLPHAQREAMDKCIDEMFSRGVIKPSVSPWNSPLLLVPKKDGTWRPVIDFRS